MQPGELWSLGDYAAAGDRWAEASTRVVEWHAAPGMAVLDVACGPGSLAIAAAGIGADVTGLDAAPGLLRLARERARAAGADVEWIEADMTSMPLEDDRFDLVASAFGCMFAPEPEAMAAELVRVCHSGGKIVTLAWTPESAFGATLPLVRPYLPNSGGGAPVARWAEEGGIREVFAELPVDIACEVRTVDIAWESLDQAMSEIVDRNPAWIGIRAAVEPTGRWPELEADLRELLATRGRVEADAFVLPVDYLETVAAKA